MKRIYLTFLFVTVVAICMAQSKHNVTLTLHVSPYINEVEQMAYVSHYEGNECIIDDSVKIVPTQNDYTLRTRVLYEDCFALSFSKRGPVKLYLLAHPHEKLKVEIDEADDQVGFSCKKLLKGSVLNDSLVHFQNTSNEFTMRIRQLENAMSVYGIPHERIEQLADSIEICKKEKVAFLLYTAAHTPSPYIANLAYTYLWNIVSNVQYKSVELANYRRFPDYPEFQRIHFHKKLAPESDNSKKNRRFLKQLTNSHVLFNREIARADSLKVGDIVDVMLVDSMGNSTTLAAFRGKFVLVEIWASWCLPCIQAMPNIQHAQRLFADDFTCVAVTIDKKRVAWLRSIQRFSLQDFHHYKATDDLGELREDMKPLAAGGAIPRNYLLDREGHIIAKDIYDEDLIKKLEELTQQ